jgi:glycosyltransferase involved in cell wall biosynthesis
VQTAIHSVLAQTFDDLELVVVDDGSVDETADVVAAIADPRLRYVFQTNAGPSAARNAGAAAGNGRVLTFLDDDDAALPTWLEELRRAAQGDADAVVTCGEVVVDPSGRELRALLPHDLGPVFEGYRALFRPGTFAVPSALFEELGGFSTDLPCSENTEFALRLLPRCRADDRPVIAVDMALVKHVQRPLEDRPQQSPAKTVQGARLVLERHEQRLARSPEVLSSWYATGGVAAARCGDYAEARRLFRSAVSTTPGNLKHRVRLAVAHLRPLGALVWRTHKYRPERTGSETR